MLSPKRKGRLTASRAGAALGVNPWQKPDDLIRAMVREYHGAEPEFSGNVATRHGNQHEPLAVLDYMSETGTNVEEAGFYTHPEHDWLGASPDGFVGTDGLLEIKCPFSLRNGGEFKSIHDQPHYHAQVQVQMACTGRKWTDFYQWSPHGTKTERVGFDPAWWAENLPKMEVFYKLYLTELDNPAHLEEKRLVINSDEAQAIVNRIGELDDHIAAMTEERKGALQRLVDMAGGKDAEICGHKLTLVKRKGNIDYAKLLKEVAPDVDTEAYRKAGTESWRFS